MSLGLAFAAVSETNAVATGENSGRAVHPWLQAETPTRRRLIALGIYLVCVAVFAMVAGKERLAQHTIWNHYAHQADAWLHGRLDLANGAPAYAMGNDFAEYDGKTYISFPPFPAVLMLPMVAIAGSPENFQDGQFVVWLAGFGPAVLFLILERLRQTGRSPRTETENATMALLFAFGTVYFFTAVMGFVWYAAHVVGVGLAAAYLLFAIDARRPLVAGLLCACGWLTRPTLLLTAVFFGLEAIRVCCKDGIPGEGTFFQRVEGIWERLDKKEFAKRVALFSVPILVAMAVLSAMNQARFHNPSPFTGHEYLGVVWSARMKKWGLFGYHYLPKNLGVMLTIMPWLPARGGADAASTAPFVINEHGLALWFTTPLYFWLFRPKEKSWLYGALGFTAALCALMNLLYQNSGWHQFGYRFSNDYSILLFVMLAIGGRPMGFWFRAAATWAVAWNLFGAVTYFRGGTLERFYFREGTQTVLYQPD